MERKLVCFFFTLALLITHLQGQTQIGGGTCSLASLSGSYAFTTTGRQVSTTGTFQKVYQANGTATFDGNGNVTFALNSNTNSGSAVQNYSGTYTLPANCLGALTATIASGDVANYSLA